MRTLGLAAVMVVRALAVVVGLWQVIGLLPAFTYSGEWPPGAFAVVVVKTVILIVCVGVFVALGKVRARLTARERKLREDARVEKSVEEFRRKEREVEDRVAAQNRAEGQK